MVLVSEQQFKFYDLKAIVIIRSNGIPMNRSSHPLSFLMLWLLKIIFHFEHNLHSNL